MLFGKGDPMDAVEEAMKRRGWRYERMDKQTIVTGVTTARNNRYFILIRHEEDRRTVLFLFTPVSDESGGGMLGRVGPGLRGIHTSGGYTSEQVSQACQLLMHHNYRILLGNFERDNSDGEVRYRIAIPYRDSTFTAEQVNWAIDAAIPTMDTYLERVDSFLKGRMPFEEAAGSGAGAGGGLVV